MQKGYSMMELLLVISVAMALIFFGMRYYQLSKYQEQVSLSKQGIAIMMEAIRNYYMDHCQKPMGWFDRDVSIDQLTQGDYMPIDAEGKPVRVWSFFTDAPVASVETTTETKAMIRLKVQARVLNPSSISYLRRLLGAENVVSDTLIWQEAVFARKRSISATNNWLGQLNLNSFKRENQIAGGQCLIL